MTLFRLHVVNIAVYVCHSRMVHRVDVPFGIRNRVHQAGFCGPDGFDGRLHAVLHKPIGVGGQRFSGAFELHIVVGLRPPHGSRDNEHIGSVHFFGERNFAAQVIDRFLTDNRTIARKVVVGREHAADAGDTQVVVAENLQCFVDFVAEIQTVVVAVKLDERNLRPVKPRSGIGERLAAKAPITPGQIEAGLQLLGRLLQFAKSSFNASVLLFKMLLHLATLSSAMLRKYLSGIRRTTTYFSACGHLRSAHPRGHPAQNIAG